MEVCPHFTHLRLANNCIGDSFISPQQSTPVRREEALTYAPADLLAQLGLGEAGVPGGEEGNEEILELRETPEPYVRWEHESQVCRVWSPLGSGLRIFPHWEQNEPNTASWVRPPSIFWDLSIPTLREVVTVMQCWPSLPEELRGVTLSALQLDVFTRVQRLVVEFYMRSFVSTYHRLPVPPALLPPNWL